MKIKFNAHMVGFLCGMLIAGAIIGQLAFNDSRKKDEAVAMPYKWQSPKLPEKIDFAGEPVPLDRWEIREEMDRQLLYNYYWQNNILYIIKLSNRYFPVI